MILLLLLLLLLLSGNPNRFLDLKQYHSLQHAATKKLIFLVRYVFLLRKINGLVSTTLEQNSGFKPERNKDLTFCDNYRDRLILKTNIVIIFLAISPSPNVKL